ncbi:hypothetical protein Tco_1463016, partial [Tanacetum coccineum]
DLHHQELAALHVRLDRVESIQIELRRPEHEIMRDVGWLGERDEVIQCRTLSLVRRVDGLSDDWVDDSIAISKLQPRMATFEERVQTLVEDGEYVQDVLDVVDTEIAKLRDIVDDYPRGQVDTLRHEVDGLHGIVATMSHLVHILETALQEVTAENLDLQTRLSVSESNERCLITCVLRMDERISALDYCRIQRNRANPAKAGGAGPAVARGIAEGAGENTRRARENTGRAGGNTRGNVAPEVRGCMYKTFLGCNPHTFSGTKGAIGLNEYYPRNELQRMEQELWNLTVKEVDIAGYTNHFHELAALCPSMVTPEYKKIERYVWGLPEKIQGNVTSSKPAIAHEAIRMAHSLTYQAVQFKAVRSGEASKRKWEDYQSGGNNNNNNRNNTHHHQQNRRQEAAKVYVAAPTKGKVYLENLPLCNRCKLHHLGHCSVKCMKCKRIGHQTKDYWSKTSAADTSPTADANA